MERLILADYKLFEFINTNLSNSLFDFILPSITDLHKSPLFLISFIALLLIFLIRAWGPKKGLQLLLITVASVLISDGLSTHSLKKTVQRTRPHTHPELVVIQRSPAGGYSFPSNHSVNTFNLAILVWTFLPKAGPWFLFFAFLTAFGRVYNGVHFPSDVIVGAILGLTIGLAISILLKKTILQQKRALK